MNRPAINRLHRQRDDIARCIADNEACIRANRGNKVLRAILDTKNRRLAHYFGRVIGALNSIERDGSGDWTPAALLGGNGHGPAIDDLISSSRFHRDSARKAVAA